MPHSPSHRSRLRSSAGSFYKTVWDYNEASSWVFYELSFYNWLRKKNSSMNREAPVIAKSDSHVKANKRTGFKVLKINVFRHHFIMCIMDYSQGDISFLPRQHLVVVNFIFYLLFLPWTPVCLPRIPSLLCQLGLIDSFPQLLEI